ncbi:hypothetical protein [Massilia alkalitolerans]|uniref:hypothetical protein n=1 Tax=Massilia alkalitolerans TaxID=286638 RepID=UPI00041C8F84|nr:hypothetical protein [Massilia alkalitolerans]
MLKYLIRSALVLGIVAAPIAPARADAPAATGEHDFKASSNIKLQALSPLQLENLAVTGKVWGFYCESGTFSFITSLTHHE